MIVFTPGMRNLRAERVSAIFYFLYFSQLLQGKFILVKLVFKNRVCPICRHTLTHTRKER